MLKRDVILVYVPLRNQTNGILKKINLLPSYFSSFYFLFSFLSETFEGVLTITAVPIAATRVKTGNISANWIFIKIKHINYLLKVKTKTNNKKVFCSYVISITTEHPIW
jgi:hypothetical protein